MTTVVLQLRDEDLRAGRVVGRVEVIRAGGGGGDASTVRDLTDLAAVLFASVSARGDTVSPPPSDALRAVAAAFGSADAPRMAAPPTPPAPPPPDPRP